MRFERYVGWVVVGALLSGCGAPPADPPLEGEIRAFLEDYMDAVGARDADRIRDAWVADERFVWIEDGAVRYRSADEMLASLAQFAPESPIRTTLSDVEVDPVGRSGAHAWAVFRTTVGEGPGAFAFGGEISFVLERQDGTWKLVGGHTSSPREP